MDAKDRRIAQLERRVAELEALLQAALEKIAQLEKHFGNSSKPPSSDIVKPPKQQDRRRKKRSADKKDISKTFALPSAYQKYSKEYRVGLQLCWAHLIREVKYISESKTKRVACYGERLLESIRAMFTTYHRKDEFQEWNWFRRIGAIVGGSGCGAYWQRVSSRARM